MSSLYVYHDENVHDMLTGGAGELSESWKMWLYNLQL